LTLNAGEQITLPDGRVFDKRGLYLEVLKHNPSNSSALNNLEHTLNATEQITLPDGRVFEQRGLYFEAYKLYNQQL